MNKVAKYLYNRQSKKLRSFRLKRIVCVLFRACGVIKITEKDYRVNQNINFKNKNKCNVKNMFSLKYLHKI